MATMRVAAKPEPAPMMAAQIPRAGGDFEIVEPEIPNPGRREVRIKVQACGVWARCCARESLPLTHCATAARVPAALLRCKALAALAIS